MSSVTGRRQQSVRGLKGTEALRGLRGLSMRAVRAGWGLSPERGEAVMCQSKRSIGIAL